MSFTRFAAYKVLYCLLTLWAIYTLTFIALKNLPGTPFDEDLAVPPEIRASLEAKYGLHDSLPTQYVRYLNQLLHGHLGESFVTGESVTKILFRHGQVSLELGVWAALWVFLFGITFGLMDKSVNTLRDLILATPAFVLASLLIWFFGFYLQIAPVALWTNWSHKLLPIFCVGLRPFCLVQKIVSESRQSVLQMPFVVALRAKGVSEHQIVMKHISKLAITPLLPLVGTMLTDLLTGALVVEFLFGLSGLGVAFLKSLSQRDYSVALGLTLVFATVLIVLNQILEVMRLVLDPRSEVA